MSLRPVVLSGPSGSGKSTLLKLLFKEFPDSFGFSVSHTTRKPRPGEEDGKHYHFTTVETMMKDIEQDKFIEHAQFSGNLYGTSKLAVQNVLESKRICLLDIDEQGVKSIKKTDFDSLYVFVAPPSLKALRERLQSRGTETEESIEKRMKTATSALEYSQQDGIYDITIVNDDLPRAYEELRNFLVKNFVELSALQNGEQSSKMDGVIAEKHEIVEANASISEIPLSPAKLNSDAESSLPAVMNVEPTIDMNDAAVLTSENFNGDLVVTDRSSSVIDLQTEQTENSAFCGQGSWGACTLV